MRVLRVLVGASLLAGCTLDSSGSAEPDDNVVDSTPVVADTEQPLPDVTLEDTGSPPEDTYDSGAPDTFAPDTFMPDTFVPDTFKPDTFMPDTFMPDTVMPDTFVPPDMGTDAGPPPCTETNAKTYNGHCYFVPGTGTSSWPAARDACIAASTSGHPAHLAVITTAGEWSFVNGLTGGAGFGRWIGLSAPSASSTKSNFKWVNGEAFGHDAWMSSHPDSSGACVVMHSATFTPSGGWEDVACSTLYVSVCERE